MFTSVQTQTGLETTHPPSSRATDRLCLPHPPQSSLSSSNSTSNNRDHGRHLPRDQVQALPGGEVRHRAHLGQALPSQDRNCWCVMLFSILSPLHICVLLAGFTLSKAIACAVEFDNQHCGIYAGDWDSYKVRLVDHFSRIFSTLNCLGVR